ncbi:MAG: polymerase subunit delta [Thermoleophilaceae bacterium]|jgi:DNA polymerase-3 subunit delta|nr:polymerase subunit delta [Thermoleophilaceae bacterium]
MADLKPAYLVCGEDDAKIDAWRGRVRRRAEDENGPGGLEALDAKVSDPDEVAAALSVLTFGTGTRYVMVDGVESWKAGQLDPLERELAAPAPDTVLVLIARGKPPARLVKAVESAKGEHREYAAPKPWELPKWAAERARDDGLRMDKEAAKRLVELAGPSQQRIAREIEKLALTIHPETQLTAEHVEAYGSGADGAQAYDMADAVVSHDIESSLRLAERLTSGGEAPGRLVWPVIRRLREVHRAAELLEAGVAERDIAGKLGTPPWIAKRTVAQAKKADRTALARALCAFADLEVDVRSGDCTDEHTGFTLALARAAS